MIYIDTTIEKLFIRFLQNRTTEEEERELYNWIAESPENRKEFYQYKRVWDSMESSNPLYKLNTEENLSKITSKINRSAKRRRAFILYSSSVAASILLFFTLFNLNNMDENKIKVNESIVSLNIPKGGSKRLILSDGTSIWLGPNSQFSYSSFENSDKREVFLRGKAYFKVAKDSSRPFIVKTDNIDIRVLGTSFNVESIEGSNITETTVIEGVVSIKPKGEENKKEIRLEMNDQAIFNKTANSFLLSDVDASQYSKWREGTIVFIKKDFNYIVGELERTFDINIDIHNRALESHLFSAKFEKGQTIEEILKVFSLIEHFEYKIEDETITIK